MQQKRIIGKYACISIYRAFLLSFRKQGIYLVFKTKQSSHSSLSPINFQLSQPESHCFCEDDKWIPWHSVTHSGLTLASGKYLISGAGDVCALSITIDICGWSGRAQIFKALFLDCFVSVPHII